MFLKFFLLLVIFYLIGFFSCYIANKKLKSKGLKGVDYWKCANPVLWYSVVIGLIFKFLVPLHVFEQYVLRFYDDFCRPNCLLSADGRCVSCGCDAIAKTFSPVERCSNDNWDKIIWNKKEYEELRKETPVEIKIIYK